ncbi:hypothetical protein LL033_26140 (plasmid) [Clostridium estertheticum]|uniref:hypothetical protein n=1 Tax=Clostridium estertheticum TaxID=238834 RepID=UPI001C0CA5AC|nr:hypothetical protein [Clostridium estertheticum]MBU3218273.1 hypothetical protein [Clostridium estertheticum]WAG58233.1 hypothetical protein LL033_26140 [Clostridium estertheticum]
MTKLGRKEQIEYIDIINSGSVCVHEDIDHIDKLTDEEVDDLYWKCKEYEENKIEYTEEDMENEY